MQKRLESLDALRGLDLFFLVVMETMFWNVRNAAHSPFMESLMPYFSHKQWEGFSTWDLIMPLFMFMSGVTIPYSMAKYRNGASKMELCRRLTKRIVLLWLFGMMVQGNLMALNPQQIYLFSNTLQAIAVGYLFAAIIFLNAKWKTQIGIAVALLLAFWGAMEFISVGGYGGGDYTEHGNLAEYIDRVVLGRFRDGAKVVDGQVVFAEWYTYTWILSSLNFIVTAMTGVFAGMLLKSKVSEKKKLLTLLLGGIGMVAVGWALNPIHPVIKHIWTSSMTLVSSGYCFLLLLVFYYVIDYRGHNRHLTFLKVYGMNSITAYVVAHVVNFSSISASLFRGLEQYTGDWYNVILTASNCTILFIILYIMYKRKIFLRV